MTRNDWPNRSPGSFGGADDPAQNGGVLVESSVSSALASNARGQCGRRAKSRAWRPDPLSELSDSRPAGEARPAEFSKNVAGSTGLEPATSGVTGQRSNQLNYDPARETAAVVGGTGLEPVTAGV